MGLRWLAIIGGLLLGLASGCAHRQVACSPTPATGCCGDARCHCMKGRCAPACSATLWAKRFTKAEKPKACCGDPRCRCMLGQPCASEPVSTVRQQPLPPVYGEPPAAPPAAPAPEPEAEKPPEKIGHLPRQKPQELKLEGPPAPAAQATRRQYAALRLEVFDLAGSVAQGDEVDYVVRVTNQGTVPGVGLSLQADIPAEMTAVAVVGMPPEVVRDRLVQIPPFELTPGVSRTFRLKLRGAREGDARVKVTLTGRDLETPVIEEESTTVLAGAKRAEATQPPSVNPESP